MRVRAGRLVTLAYRLTDDTGRRVNQALSDAPLQYVHGVDRLFGGADAHLAGRSPGAIVSVDISPEDGFGLHDERLVYRFERGDGVGLPPSVSEADESPWCTAGAAVSAIVGGEPRTLWVRHSTPEALVLDGNDPLAGLGLKLVMWVIDVCRAP